MKNNQFSISKRRFNNFLPTLNEQNNFRLPETWVVFVAMLKSDHCLSDMRYQNGK